MTDTISEQSKKNLLESSIAIMAHASTVRRAVERTVLEIFGTNEDSLLKTSVDDYRSLMLKAQTMLCAGEYQRKILKQIEVGVFEYAGTDRLLIQSNLYLRASRPGKPKDQENIDWHREAFYGPNLGKSINIWTPIRGVCARNTLRYIPNSQSIPDKDIATVNVNSPYTKRFSDGHKLGFNYSPKVIVSGVDLAKATVLNVPKGHSAVFSGNLIHGAAINRSNTIRFSVDFQIIRKADYSSLNKKSHFSSGKEYFVEY